MKASKSLGRHLPPKASQCTVPYLPVLGPKAAMLATCCESTPNFWQIRKTSFQKDIFVASIQLQAYFIISAVFKSVRKIGFPTGLYNCSRTSPDFLSYSPITILSSVRKPLLYCSSSVQVEAISVRNSGLTQSPISSPNALPVWQVKE